MSYIEWLRVRNVLRVTVIILAILVVLAVILRISFARYMSPDQWMHHMALEPGTKVTESTLPDGTKRTILDNPDEQKHVVIDNHGASGIHMVITEPTKHGSDSDHVNIGSIQVVESHHGAVTTTVVDTNGSVPMIYYMALADVVALIVATILAAPFAREMDGHLEVVFTKPVSRLRYALGAIGADVAGIVAASVLTVIAFYLCQLLFETPRLDFSGINARAIAMGIAAPLAWYAMICAATTWIGRAYGAVMGFAWPVAGVIAILAMIAPSNVVALFVHDVASALNRLDPLSYTSFGGMDHEGTSVYEAGNFGLRLAMEGVLFVVYGALALIRWQRVEA